MLLAALSILTTGLSRGQEFNHITFEGGVGATIPSGAARDRFTTGFNFLLGGGWNLNPHIAGLLEFQYSHSALTQATLVNFGQADGFNRFWSLTANPRYTFHPQGRLSGYGTAGYGLYSRRLAFTDPSQAGGFCDPFYGCQTVGAPVVAEVANYKGGFNAGGGVSYLLGGLHFFGDVRYHRFLSHTYNEFTTLSFGIRY